MEKSHTESCVHLSYRVDTPPCVATKRYILLLWYTLYSIKTTFGHARETGETRQESTFRRYLVMNEPALLGCLANYGRQSVHSCPQSRWPSPRPCDYYPKNCPLSKDCPSACTQSPRFTYRKLHVWCASSQLCNHGWQLLANTTNTVAEICFSCGFNNQSNFIRVFKKIKGQTPSDYRTYIQQTLIKY